MKMNCELFKNKSTNQIVVKSDKYPKLGWIRISTQFAASKYKSSIYLMIMETRRKLIIKKGEFKRN